MSTTALSLSSAPAVDHTMSSVYFALGVLSHAKFGKQRRALVRGTWGKFAQRPAGKQGGMLMRLVVGMPSGRVGEAIAAESAKYGDMVSLAGGGAEDGFATDHLYAFKGLAWLRHASQWAPQFIGLADDDSFVYLGRVLGDLRFLQKSGTQNIVYGRFEWACYDRDNARNSCWGRDAFGSTFDWRRMTGITEDKWPSAQGTRSRAEAPLLADMRQQAAKHPSLSLPFPFQRGPLMIWSANVAALLGGADSDVASETAHARALYRKKYRLSPKPPRMLIDIFIGHLMASARAGRGLRRLTLVDIGPSYLELRATLQRNMSQPLPGARVVHLNRKHLQVAVDLCNGSQQTKAKGLQDCTIPTEYNNDVALPITMSRVLREYMARLSQGAGVHLGHRLDRYNHCARRDWWNATGYVVLAGGSWKMCDFTDSKYGMWVEKKGASRSPLYSTDLQQAFSEDDDSL